MTQDGGTMGGTFHDDVDCCRESQGWTMACSSMPERDGKDQGQDTVAHRRPSGLVGNLHTC